MKIPELGSIQMIRTNEAHFGTGRVIPLFENVPGNGPVSAVEGVSRDTEAVSVNRADGKSKSFQQYLMDAVQSVNQQQLDVNSLQEKLITNPDEVDIHDVTIAMGKARMSLNLAQTVIDRLVQGWSEISTTR